MNQIHFCVFPENFKSFYAPVPLNFSTLWKKLQNPEPTSQRTRSWLSCRQIFNMYICIYMYIYSVCRTWYILYNKITWYRRRHRGIEHHLCDITDSSSGVLILHFPIKKIQEIVHILRKQLGGGGEGFQKLTGKRNFMILLRFIYAMYLMLN